MSGYVSKALECLQHTPPKQTQYAWHEWNKPVYGQCIQYVNDNDKNTPLLDKKETKQVQSVVGPFLYYARAVDLTMLPALNEIASKQAKTTEKTKMLMDYAFTHPNAIIRYYTSGMILYIDSDAAYLVMPNVRSRIAGHFFLSGLPPAPPEDPHPKPNGMILTECKVL